MAKSEKNTIRNSRKTIKIDYIDSSDIKNSYRLEFRHTFKDRDLPSIIRFVVFYIMSLIFFSKQTSSKTPYYR